MQIRPEELGEDERTGRSEMLPHYNEPPDGSIPAKIPFSALLSVRYIKVIPKGKHLKNKNKPETSMKARAVLGASAKLVCVLLCVLPTQVKSDNVCK